MNITNSDISSMYESIKSRAARRILYVKGVILDSNFDPILDHNGDPIRDSYKKEEINNMSRLKWDQVGEREYEVGVDHGVLYPQSNGSYPKGVAWNGLITVSESPSGAEDSPLYADNMKYLNLKSAEEFGGSIECYSYPDEWAQCNGEEELIEGVMLSQQKRNTFGFSYRTKIGNDVENEDHGYKIHLWYGCSASPSERSYGTINDSPEAITFSYEVTSTPVPCEGFKPVSAIVIDSTRVDKDKLATFEEILYGKDGDGDVDGVDPRLPLPEELKILFAAG